jgi:hypothetical protein
MPATGTCISCNAGAALAGAAPSNATRPAADAATTKLVRISFSSVEGGHGRSMGGVPAPYDTGLHHEFSQRAGQGRVAG